MLVLDKMLLVVFQAEILGKLFNQKPKLKKTIEPSYFPGNLLSCLSLLVSTLYNGTCNLFEVGRTYLLHLFTLKCIQSIQSIQRKLSTRINAFLLISLFWKSFYFVF